MNRLQHAHAQHRRRWHGRLREELRRYYGRHLHRRLFVWFGVAIFLTTLMVGWIFMATGGAMQHRPFRPLLFLGLPAFVLWLASGKVARRIARPLYELVQVSREIGRGNLKARARLEPWGIGEIAFLSESVNEMAARIEKQVADQRELLAGVSHELRTPLTRLRLLIELQREGSAPPDALQAMEREVVEIDTLVGELLASARLDFQALSPRPLDAVELATRALERAGLPADKLDASAPSIALSADPTLVARALANLLDNAAKHGKGVQRLRVAENGGRVVFEVEDRGPGFPAPASDPGTPPARAVSRSENSLGLGLTLVDRIARAHGGSLRTGNRAEGGARVALELAASPPAAASA